MPIQSGRFRFALAAVGKVTAAWLTLPLPPPGTLVRVSHAGQVTRLAPHRVQPVDSTGAGDCFAGCLLARLAAGDDVVSAARAANVVAALSTLGFGAVAPLPTWPQVQAALAGQG